MTTPIPAGQTRRTALVRDERFLGHDPGPGHPESPDRLRVIYRALDEAPPAGECFVLPPREASPDQLAWNHSPEYVERIARAAAAGLPRSLDPDTVVGPGSWEAAVLAVGGVFAAVDALVEGRADTAFALVRPPGHHAEAGHAMGFCLFNNVALGARYARKVHGIDRVLVADWDLHHGNGTQHSFYEDPSVLYFSTHQFPYYPGSGRVEEAGHGEGEGFTVNVPLPPGVGDAGYAAVFDRVLAPAADRFRPGLVLVSAGFDPFIRDPLGGMRVTARGFGALAARVLTLAGRHCGGRVLFCLEGGYDPAGLRDGVRAVLAACAEGPGADPGPAPDPGPEVARVIDRVIEVHRGFQLLG
ncbi:histone deacetylase [Dissulfurirhabdus thermomarina]|uniref:Histone deacetylase n=1 Tax=Dissulfurirhabdus thermomarina TaxID=1765737 RepID=A0A6N9TM81_DISTH|nr:histone deacetylase [Dissulfurirhabdus thermomarina]NDY42229.1 histone deacetylase [Dissulfurirhabdus thermomarina]NMX23155.1 histone deacetylase [Dissulfurirhabdus thermomarina]